VAGVGPVVAQRDGSCGGCSGSGCLDGERANLRSVAACRPRHARVPCSCREGCGCSWLFRWRVPLRAMLPASLHSKTSGQCTAPSLLCGSATSRRTAPRAPWLCRTRTAEIRCRTQHPPRTAAFAGLRSSQARAVLRRHGIAVVTMLLAPSSLSNSPSCRALVCCYCRRSSFLSVKACKRARAGSLGAPSDVHLLSSHSSSYTGCRRAAQLIHAVQASEQQLTEGRLNLTSPYVFAS
jgi:hypothetical protein